VRILRVRLRNYRGIEDREVRFERNGVTILQGPNEIGKSCFAEAIDVVFEHPDSSKKLSVLALKPVIRDVGTEIEMDVETGPYAFTYFKRYHKRHETRLEVRRPRPESLTGREAHERVCAILDETLDRQLWGALRVQQGEGTVQPPLQGQTALSRAFDKAAGTVPAGQREVALLEAVDDEFGEYWTDGGKPKADRKDAREAVERGEVELAALEEELRSLEGLVRRSAELSGALASLRRSVDVLEQNDRARRAEWEALAPRRAQIEQLEVRIDEARAREDAVRREEDERERARCDLVEAERAVQALREAEASDQPAHAAAKLTLERSEAEVASKREGAQRTRVRMSALQQCFEAARDRFDLKTLEERYERIQRAISASAEAQELLDRTKVTEPLVKRITEAEIALRVEDARLRERGPQVRILAREEIEIRLEGETIRLARDEAREFPVGDKRVFDVPRIFELTVDSGTSPESRDAARARLEKLCRDAGVTGPAEAHEVLESRRAAERTIAERERILQADLRDLELDEMTGKIRGLRAQLERYGNERPGGDLETQDLGELRRLHVEATVAEQRSAEDVRTAERTLDAARTQWDRVRDAATDRNARLGAAAEAVRRTRERLDALRRGESDDALAGRLLEATSRLAEGQRACDSARREYSALNPEGVEALAKNAAQAYQRQRDELRELEEEEKRAAVSLEILGAKGLHERSEESRRRLEGARRRLESLESRALAVELLRRTLREHRESAQRAYVAPLRERIESLGRLVFGPAFSVQLDGELRVESRTLDGITLPFESLSVGTREQLAVMCRLACAMIVAPDGGVPVILDDSLGYSDPARLETMGAVLAGAGRECQVIVLTCMPERYRHVGGARVVSLS